MRWCSRTAAIQWGSSGSQLRSEVVGGRCSVGDGASEENPQKLLGDRGAVEHGLPTDVFITELAAADERGRVIDDYAGGDRVGVEASHGVVQQPRNIVLRHHRIMPRMTAEKQVQETSTLWVGPR